MKLTQAMLRQPVVEDSLPKYGHALTPSIFNVDDDHVMCIFRLMGMPFESVTEIMIESSFDALNRNIASLGKRWGNRLSVTSTMTRRLLKHDLSYRFESEFARRVASKYLAAFSGGKDYVNTFYLSFMLKYDELEEGITDLEEISENVQKFLEAYDCEPLSVYELNGMLFSEAFEFLGELINGVERRVPVGELPAYEAIPHAWMHWHYDTVEMRADDATRFAVCYDAKEIPTAGSGQLDPLLKLAAEFTLTQSLSFLGTRQTNSKIETQIGKLVSVQDKAVHQIAELKHAQAANTGEDVAFGEFHSTLIVYGETAEKAIINGVLVASESLSKCQLGWIKATGSAPVTFYSQLPGATTKPRPSPKSSLTFTSLNSLHNYSTGKAKGNPIGDGSALIPLKTDANGRYDFSCHASRPKEDNRGEKIAGHTYILGTTGSGKTVLQLMIVTFLERFKPKIFAVDLDRGMEIFIRNLGGTYYPLKAGQPTGLAPFDLPPTLENLQFLYSLVRACARGGIGQPEVDADDSEKIKCAVDAVYEVLPVENRTFSRLLESIPEDGTPNSLKTRLSKWCWAAGGEFAWALDNVPNSMSDVTLQRRIGFDVTDFLKPGYEPTEPVLAYLFYLKSLMQERGGLMVTIIEEFWLPAQYKVTQDLILKSLKTGRKIEEFVLLVSQSPEDVIRCPIFPAIQQQTATKVHLPNPGASYEAYKQCDLNPKEFAEHQKLQKNSRRCLIKQDHQSVIVNFDMEKLDMWDELAVLSASTDNIPIWEEVWAEFGPDLDKCMPVFQARRKGRRNANSEPRMIAYASDDSKESA